MTAPPPRRSSADPADLVTEDLLRFDHRPDDWYRWRDRLPFLAARVLEEWSLTPDGMVSTGQCSLVVGATMSDGQTAALKLGWSHPESRHEHLALRAWAGRGAVQLLRADPTRGVLLLERAEAADLSSIPAADACLVVADLYRRLHRPALPQLDRLSDVAGRWSSEFRALPVGSPVPRRFVEQASALAARFAGDPDTDGTLIHSDLHYDNVLAAHREPWLAIDPKPLSGDPCFEVPPMLWNRWDEIDEGAGIRAGVRRRMDTIVSAADLDPDRVRDWMIVRALDYVKESLTGRALSALDRDWITRCVTVIKAVQD